MGFFDRFRAAKVVGEKKTSSSEMDVTYHEVGWRQLHGAPYFQSKIKACPQEFDVTFMEAPRGSYYAVSVMWGGTEVGYFMDLGTLTAAGYSVGDCARARKVRQLGSDTAPWTIEVPKRSISDGGAL